MATIELREISKRYDNGFCAVDRVSLTIADGEFVVLVGPSGCGKSTTLRMIAGLEEISQGDLLIDGRRVNDLQPGDRDIAMVFQNYALYPHMTVRENLSFGLQMRRTPREEIQRRIEQVAQTLSIGPLLDRRPRQLSGGQRQRVALGRALVRQPKAFLFDEPLSNLDAKLRVQMRSEIARLHQQLKTTTVYVTHDQVEAMTLGQRIVVMKDGVIQQADRPLELYSRPANQFVATFIGSPAMNLLSGSITNGRFLAKGVDYPLGRTLTTELQSGEWILGFRPEDLLLDPPAPKLAEATTLFVERMGFETVVHYDLAGAQGVARLRGDHDVSGQTRLELRLPTAAWHLFSADASGRRVLSGSQ
jgi:multiple sugar transport system ATP-binding protein